MKNIKRISGFLFTIVFLAMATLPVMAKEIFTAYITEATKSKEGDRVVINYDNASNEDIVIEFNNEYDKKIYTYVYSSETKGKINLELPPGPITKFFIHIKNGSDEVTLTGEYVFEHEHVGEYVEFIRPTEKDPGRMEYYKCECGKCFEDRECTIEITDNIDTWSYLPPVPREEWREGDPVVYVEKYDGKNTFDPDKPNPTWNEEDVIQYYDQEEKLQEPKENIREVEENENTLQLAAEVEKDIETPVAYCVEPVKEVKVTVWERIKGFFLRLIKG